MIDVARIYATVVALGAVFSPPVTAEPSQSSYINDVRIDMSTVKKFADESDNFAWLLSGFGVVVSRVPRGALRR
jgi:hypothetical protein